MTFRWPVRFVAAVGAMSLLLAACSGTRIAPRASSVHDDHAITIGSFDFAESSLLAELYAEALEAGGYPVHRTFDLGPREFVIPAMAAGLVDLVPEYAGTSEAFLSLTGVPPRGDTAAVHALLLDALRHRGITALSASPAQDANTFVVDRGVAQRLGLHRLSDLSRVASTLSVGGPPECPSRPLCLGGLEKTYGLKFKEFVTLDAGGPLTRQALASRSVDVALLFTTDPSIGDAGFVELTDDRSLQPAENVTPLVRADAIERWGPGVVTAIDRVSAALTTAELRSLNAAIAGGGRRAAVASSWLTHEGLS